MMELFQATRGLRALFLGIGLAALSSGCVTKARYDEASAELKYYQRLYQDLESFQAKLEAENAKLRGELGIHEGATIEASLTEDIDQRMAELEDIASRLSQAPGDVTVLSVEGGYGLRLKDAILFESGSADLRPAGHDLLVNMAREIGARPYERIWVRGHTDSDPVKKPETLKRFPRGNLQLSAERAIEVATLLGQEGGIDAKRVVVAGFGPNDPVAPNDSATNKQQNRRVEIFVIEDESAARGE
jgi:chemotaxis protein MotB